MIFVRVFTRKVSEMATVLESLNAVWHMALDPIEALFEREVSQERHESPPWNGRACFLLGEAKFRLVVLKLGEGFQQRTQVEEEEEEEEDVSVTEELTPYNSIV